MMWSPNQAPSYRRVMKLASGGMGSVDLVVRREGAFERLYAMKRMHPHLREDPEVRAMFLDEARVAGLIRHPNVVSVIDVGEDADGPFLVMEYVEGVALTKLIDVHARAETPLPLDVALALALDVARGLDAVHELKSNEGQRLDLVHRDISPHNILVGHDGVARITDFGIARSLGRSSKTSTGILKGKLGYMSPEQLQFVTPDQRSDIFAFGVVLFEMLAGRRLYPAKDQEQCARRVLTEPPPDLGDEREDVPVELTGLLFRMLAKEPGVRPAGMREIVPVLEEAYDAVRDSMRGSLEGVMRAKFGEQRAEVQASIAESLRAATSEAQRVTSEPPPPGSEMGVSNGQASPSQPPTQRIRQAPMALAPEGDERRRPRALLFALALLGIVAVAGAAFYAASSDPLEADVPTTTAATVNAPPPAAEVSPPPATSAANVESTTDAEADEAEDTAEEAPARVNQRRRRPRRSDSRPAKSGVRLWNWN